MPPKISIITPNYNGAKYLEESILSVINQNYPNIEYIIIDGGSTDNSIEIIKKYKQYITYWVSEKDKGIYDAMNKGINVANGDYLYFMGSDDRLESNILNQLFLDENQITKYYLIYGKIKNNITQSDFGDEINMNNINSGFSVHHQACFFSKILFEKFGNYDIKYKIAADSHFIIKSISLENYLFVNKIIASFNPCGISSTKDDWNFSKDYCRIVRKYIGIDINEKEYFIKLANFYFFNFIYKGDFFYGLIQISKISFKTKEFTYCIKNSLYWLKMRLIE